MKPFPVIFLLLWLTACATNTPKVEPSEEKMTPEDQEPPLSQKVYFLQHKLISDWLFASDGAFFFDMINGSVSRFLEAASDIVSDEYAENIAITTLVEQQAVVLSFPEPQVPPNCYFALLRKQGDQYAYYTYEKTIDALEQSSYGVLGAWDATGNHANFGTRNYQSQEAFIDDVLANPL